MAASRDTSLDMLRIFACLMVVAIHTYAPVLNEGYQPTFRWWEANLMNSFSRWAVPVFVMMSGYLLLNRNSLPRRGRARVGALQGTASQSPPPSLPPVGGGDLARRLTRIGVPLLVWTAIYLLVTHLFYEQLPLEAVLHKIVSGAPHYHLYFLFAMLGLAVVTPFLRWFLSRTSLSHHIVLFLVLYALALSHKYLADANAFTFFIRFAPFYLLGYLVRDIKFPKTMLLIGFILCCLGMAMLQQYTYLLPLPLLSSLCAFLFALQVSLHVESKFLLKLSNATLGIYLIHPLFLPHVSAHLPLMLAWLATFLLSAFSVLLLMKIPLIRKTVA